MSLWELLSLLWFGKCGSLGLLLGTWAGLFPRQGRGVMVLFPIEPGEEGGELLGFGRGYLGACRSSLGGPRGEG